MKTELQEITVMDLVEGYNDDGEGGVVGYGGKLDIRPPYQREFVYKEKQRDAVLYTVRKGFSLNEMHWVKNDSGVYEVLDGQQRTISICSYVAGDFSIDGRAFHNLEKEEQEQILNYKLRVNFCEGEAAEKLDWFKTINVAGEELTDQELRNATYRGPWLADAKGYFSKVGGPAYAIASDYMAGHLNRQKYLETAIDWISGGHIEEYMAANQHKPKATELWLYFQQVIAWVAAIFPNPKHYKKMKGLPWGEWYNTYGQNEFNPEEIETEVKQLLLDEDVDKNAKIFHYILTREEKYLNLRVFSDKQKEAAYQNQSGICRHCKKKYDYEDMEADHVIPWSKGGKTTTDNCQVLCKKCNGMKSDK